MLVYQYTDTHQLEEMLTVSQDSIDEDSDSSGSDEVDFTFDQVSMCHDCNVLRYSHPPSENKQSGSQNGTAFSLKLPMKCFSSPL